METSQNIIESEQVQGGGGGMCGEDALQQEPQFHHHHDNHHHQHHHSVGGDTSSSGTTVEGGGAVAPANENCPRNGNEEPQQQCPERASALSMDGQPRPSRIAEQHLNEGEEESTGSGATSMMEGDSLESSTNPMDDSQHTSATVGIHPAAIDEDDEEAEDHGGGGGGGDHDDDDADDDDEDHEEEDHDEDEEMDGLEDGDSMPIAANPPVIDEPPAANNATAAEKPPVKKEPAAKRFKCLHCSKSYVREFQLNTHVRKYHPEKPVKQQETTTPPTTTAVVANTSPSWTQADMEDALESLKSEKMSLVKASQQYGIPASTLWQRATRLGIMIPKNMARTSSKDGVADAVQLLKTGQISVNKASKVFGIPPSTLYKIAKREGIQLSSPFNSATTSWTQENLQLAMDAIRTGQMSVHMASVEFKIPPGTLYGRCKREGLELSRNNPVQWSPRDLKNALEAVKTGQMSINQASEHYKISYSSLYKRVKPHFVNNNNNNNSSSNSNQNLPKLANELGETDLLHGQGILPGMDVVSMQQQQQQPQQHHHHLHHPHPHPQQHPMDYEVHRHRQTIPQPQQVVSPVNHHTMQMHYGNTVPQHHQHHPSHYGQQQQQQQQQMLQQSHQVGGGGGGGATMHHYPVAAPVTGVPQQQHQAPMSVVAHRSHHPQHHQQLDESVHLHQQQHHHHQQQQSLMQVHQGSNGATVGGGPMQDDRVGGYPCHDVDKHGLTSSSGIGLVSETGCFGLIWECNKVWAE